MGLRNHEVVDVFVVDADRIAADSSGSISEEPQRREYLQNVTAEIIVPR